MKLFKTFWKRIFFLLLIYSSSRILFYFFNSSSFSENIILSILEGIRFDISALFYINIPLLILLLFPIESICNLIIFITRKVRAKARRILSPVIKLLEYCKNIKTKIWYQKMTNILFYVINIPFIVINNVDIEYFKFTQKRSSIDIIDLLSLGGGTDAFNFIPQYVIDYWHVTIITIIQIFLLLKIKKFDTKGFNGIREIFKKIGIFIRNKNEGLINYKRIISILFILVLLFICLMLSKSLPFLLFINLLAITFISIGYFITYILNPDLNIKKWIIYILIGYLLIYFYLQDIWSRTDTWNVIIFLIYMSIPILLIVLRGFNKISYSNFNKWITSFIIPIILLGISYLILFKNLSGHQEIHINAVSNKFIFFLSSIIILFLTTLSILIKLYPKEKGIKEMIIFLLSCYILILGARGGTQLKPIKPIHAGILSNTQNSALILNTPFCILHSYFSKGLVKHNYFTEEEINKIYPTTHKFEGNFQKKNVIIIILESFSKEYVGYYNDRVGFTPFLDSLIPHSLVMENAYANGVKSIEAVPSITSSVPTLMNEPYITSPYATNSCNSLTGLLKEEGYSTSFFHGGSRGTMGFYSYTKKIGFNNYFGIEEFLHNGGRKEDDDKVWGAYDGPFFKYFSEYLKKEQKPFITTFFSITSHPPFTLPIEFKNTFPKGNNSYHETVGYTDQMLKEFFERSKKEEWYKNTLFIITADHTSGESSDSDYKNRVGRYSIPIIYFMGDSSLKGSNTTITQQIDVMPTILDILNYNKKFFGFGKSVLGKSISSDESWAISNLYYDEHLLIHKEGFLIGREEEYTNFSDKNLKEETKINEDAIKLLKAIKQKYNNSLIDNKMNINEN
jgi:phosphoglycerol transferase MdoB-like AlkP superfamily enzyme